MRQRYAKRTEEQKRGLCWVVGSKRQQERLAAGASLENSDAEIARLNAKFGEEEARMRAARHAVEDRKMMKELGLA